MRRVGVSRLTSNNQVTLIEPVREFLGLVPGDYVLFVENGDGLLVVKKALMVEAETGCVSS